MSPRKSDDARLGRFGRSDSRIDQLAQLDGGSGNRADDVADSRGATAVGAGPVSASDHTDVLPQLDEKPVRGSDEWSSGAVYQRGGRRVQNGLRPDGPSAQKITVTRAVAARSGQAAKSVTRRVVAASRADGASESGLTKLIWNQVLSFGSDAMITVALAGTVFFSAAQSDQKGNVLSYLLITMAPFAVLAPVIGPILDRFQHGRRWAMAISAFGRAILAVLMAQHFTNLLLLFPLALGSLVLSKGYSVVRAAAAPRVVPSTMTLVTANARLSMFGLVAAMVGGAFIAIVIRGTGSYPLGLYLTAIAFAVTGYFSLRLPREVDSASPATRHPEEPPRPEEQQPVPALARIKRWVGRGFERHVITSIQGASLLRWSQGFLTMFLAFYVERTSHGAQAALSLGAVAVAAGVGNFIGTAAGARLRLGHPHVIVIACTAAAAAASIVTAVMFSLTMGVICMSVSAVGNSLGKLSLDAVVQRDVDETLRSSAFARSETFLQLAWVVGAAVALLLPADEGTLGFTVSGVFLGVSLAFVVLRSRSMAAHEHRLNTKADPAPGTV